MVNLAFSNAMGTNNPSHMFMNFQHHLFYLEIPWKPMSLAEFKEFMHVEFEDFTKAIPWLKFQNPPYKSHGGLNMKISEVI